MSHGLLDCHDVCYADVAEPFPIAYICEIYVAFSFAHWYDHAAKSAHFLGA